MGIGILRDRQQIGVLRMLTFEGQDVIINDGEGHFVVFIVYEIMLRRKAQGRSHVQYMLRTGCSWNILCTAVCVCNICG
jgi:hypothetical protein